MTVWRDNAELLELTTVDLRDRTPEDGAYLRMLAEDIAVDEGIASTLIICPVHLTPQGITRAVNTPGTPRDFNAGIALQLRDGCWLV